MNIRQLVRAAVLGLVAAMLMPFFGLDDGAAQQQATGKRVALVIGNSEYTGVPPLRSPAYDAERWASELEGAGFAVDTCLNCSREQMIQKLDEFGDGIKKDDEAFFFYSGHGTEHNGINYMIPVDVEDVGDCTLDNQAVTLDLAFGEMRKAKLKVVVLDACRDSPFPVCTKDLKERVYAPPKNEPEGTLIAFATAQGNRAVDNGRGSAFSNALLRFAFVPGKSFVQAVAEATPVVKQETNSAQIPWIHGTLSEKLFVLVPVESPQEAAKKAWSQIVPLPDSMKKTLAALDYLAEHGRSGVVQVEEAKDYLSSGLPEPSQPVGGPNWRSNSVHIDRATEMRFIGLDFGGFSMGSSEDQGQPNERPQWDVRVSPFAIAHTEVTQAQWAAVVRAAAKSRDPDAAGLRSTPSRFKGAQRPVENVSWCDAIRFSNALSRLDKRKPVYTIGESCGSRGEVGWDKSADGYRLPTEAEWEYAARAGNRSFYALGDGESSLKELGWYVGNSGNQTHDVCSAPLQPWGLCDMHGNVWEWTWDWYAETYDTSFTLDPAGPTQGMAKVLRGGSWFSGPELARSAYRYWLGPSTAAHHVGFRLVMGGGGE